MALFHGIPENIPLVRANIALIYDSCNIGPNLWNISGIPFSAIQYNIIISCRVDATSHGRGQVKYSLANHLTQRSEDKIIIALKVTNISIA